ncbi:MAG: hypothetical protein Q9170_005472 [Blastenia crenularia]
MQVGSRGLSLLRSQTNLFVFLAPSVSSTSSATTLSLCRTYIAISNVARCRQSLNAHSGSRQASSSAAAAQRPSSDDDNTNAEPRPLLRSSRRTPEELRSRQSTLLDRFRNPSKYQTTQKTQEERSREIESLLTKGVGSTTNDSNQPATNSESSADYVDRMRAEERSKDFMVAQESRGRQGNISRAMFMPPARDSLIGQPPSVLFAEATRATATIKSRPSLGRTVLVMPERGMDLGRALRSLDINCNVNNVRKDAREQKYYERPGLKRKRLKGERWRKRFKVGFKAVVAKVKTMRRKGW